MKKELCAGGGIAVAIGDGANDVPMLRAADVSVAYRARPVARAAAAHAINYCGARRRPQPLRVIVWGQSCN